MQRLRELAPALYLAILAAAGGVFAASSWGTVTGYRSGYALDRSFAPGAPLASRVVLVVFDGLRADRALQLPGMRALAERGASGILRAPLPSLSGPARAAMATGAWPEVSGVTNNSIVRPSPVQSLFGLARSQGAATKVVGSLLWRNGFGGHIDEYHGFSRWPPTKRAADLIAWQSEICGEVIGHLEDSPAALRVVDLLMADEAGHDNGGESDEYRQVTAAVDECLGRMVSAFGDEATVVVASDHGQVHRWGKGGHGGEEPEVLFAPFSMAGPGVRRSESIEGEMVDIAPTIAALLGLPIPANSQGRILWEAIDVPPEEADALRAREREQREALEAHMPDRAASLASLRRGRAPLAALAAAWFLGVAVAAALRMRPGSLAASLAVFAAAYGGLFYLFRLGYSISAVVRQEYLYSFFARDVLAAALAYWAAAALLHRLSGGSRDAGMRLAVVVTSALALLVTATHYRHGLRMEGWMIEIGPGFTAYMHLLAIVGVALGAVAFLSVRLLAARRSGSPA